MDITHHDYLLTALHRVISVAALLLCLLTEVFIFASERHAATYGVPLCAIVLLYGFRRRADSTSIYLMDFSCLKPPPRLRLPIPKFLEHCKLFGCFEDDDVEFMAKTMEESGMGNEAYFPPSLHFIPPDLTYGNAVEEARMTLLFPTLDELFAKAGVPPSTVGVVVVSCSGFCPAPSLAAIIANNYRMRSDVKTFNVSGMGCSAGVVGVDIARNVLSTHPTISYAVAVSAEVITFGWYKGRDHSKLSFNCLFRTGCSAALLTNKRGGVAGPVPAAKYRLVRLVRTNQIADDESYYACYREEDDQGITGFNARRGVATAFQKVLRAHLVTLGPSVLPWREKLRYVTALLRSRLHQSPAAAGNNLRPSFRTAADHFCLPAAWGPMIRRIGQGLGLGDQEMEPALMTFQRFGNQAAATHWYQLAYLEAKRKVPKGHKVWHLCVGTGFKVNSAVWERVDDAADEHGDLAAAGRDGKCGLGPWVDCIHRYPVSE